MSNTHYDLIVIGSGPAGQKGAIAASKVGKRVAVIERKGKVGGGSLHTGTIPSKTLREAILYLSGFRQRVWYGKDYRLKERPSIADLGERVVSIVEREMQIVHAQLSRNRIDLIYGTARFTDPRTVEVESENETLSLTADYFLIACGSRSATNPKIPFDGKRISDSDRLFHTREIPRRAIVVGAGVIGIEYASMLTALDAEVTIIERRPTILDFADKEMVDSLICLMRRRGATFRLGENVVSVTHESEDRVVAILESGKKIVAEALLYTVGRETNADLLNLSAAGIKPDERGKIKVNDRYQTSVSHIYAAGDVIGFPALASSSMEQGRLASCHMFGIPGADMSPSLPYGIYTIPEMAMFGKTEQELTEAKTPYEFGIAKYEELAKGQMMGDESGLLKLLVDPKSRKLLGVHIIGDGAAELIHLGQAVITLGASIEYFRDSVFNYPTLTEAYKVAALDVLNKL